MSHFDFGWNRHRAVDHDPFRPFSGPPGAPTPEGRPHVPYPARQVATCERGLRVLSPAIRAGHRGYLKSQ